MHRARDKPPDDDTALVEARHCSQRDSELALAKILPLPRHHRQKPGGVVLQAQPKRLGLKAFGAIDAVAASPITQGEVTCLGEGSLYNLGDAATLQCQWVARLAQPVHAMLAERHKVGKGQRRLLKQLEGEAHGLV